MGLKMKNVNIIGVHQFVGEGGHEKQYIWEIAQKGWLGQFAGGLAKNREGDVFDRV